MVHKKNNNIQTGRNLPHRFNSYSPSHRDMAISQAPEVIVAEPRRGWGKKILSLLVLVIVLVILAALAIGIWDARNISAAESKMFGTSNIFQLLSTTPLNGSNSGRINILLVGYSIDDPGHEGSTLTDSIILLSMSTTNPSGYLLSIPRDLYVKIPGYGFGKINEAYNDGGINLLEQVVANDFQVPIDYYALIDYAAVRDTVNALGGIDVTVNSPDGRLYDPNRDYATHTSLVDLSNGVHHLNGEQALDFTRARGDPSIYGTAIGFEQSDFQRTADQRQVLTAIKSKLNWKLVLDPRKNSQILNAVATNVKTDIKAGEIRSIFAKFNRIPSSKLTSLNLRDLNGQNYLSGTYYEGDTLSPAAGLADFSQIDSALQQYNQ